MILQSLYDYYTILLSDPNCSIAPPGYSPAKVSYALILSSDGELIDIRNLKVQHDKKALPRELIVPEQRKRSSNILPNFLCDNGGYVLGLDEIKKSNKGKKAKENRGREKFEEFRSFQKQVLGFSENSLSPAATAVLKFLENWNPERALEHAAVNKYRDDLANANLVFQLDGDTKYVHEYPEIKAAWENFTENQTSELIGKCLVTGKIKPIAKIHPNIKGVRDAQSSGAALVSFNSRSFCSYGKEQSYNAPVSQEAAFAYTTSLNYLLADPDHRMQMAGTTLVFWSEKPGGLEEKLFSLLLNPPLGSSGKEVSPENQTENPAENNAKVIDPETDLLLKDALKRANSGLPIRNWSSRINPDVNFFILGLSPNNSRLSVRFWLTDTLGSFAEKIGQHYNDLSIIGQRTDTIPVWMILRETAVQHESGNIHPLLEGVLMRSVLTGMPYPENLYSSIIIRIRADHDINYIRAAVIKAYLIRKYRKYGNKTKEEVISVSLNDQSTDTAYRLGRLFAVLEKVQQIANPNINATIRDRYFSSASATPAAVFPQLLKLFQYHLSRLENKKSATYWDKQAENILTGIDAFPVNLNLEEQGKFILGYYHQRENFYIHNSNGQNGMKEG